VALLIVVAACSIQDDPRAGPVNPSFTRGQTRGAGGSPDPLLMPQGQRAGQDQDEGVGRFDEDLGAYLIGPRDLLQIKVFEDKELSAKVRVNRSGFITLPLLGSIKVAGRNNTEVEQVIAEHLAKDYLQDPHVAVFIEEYASQKVTVEGYVKSPGVFPMEGRTTLLQAIALAGGVTDIADTAEILVFRNPYGQNREVLNYNLDEIHDGKLNDPLLHGTDIVVVDSSSSRRLIKDVSGTLRGFLSFGVLPAL
jgi:polysaccharide export outer membrane protein